MTTGPERTTAANATLLDFTDRAVVLTGATSGMGAAALSRFNAAGATVHALDIELPGTADADETANAQAISGPATFHHCDLGDRTSIDAVTNALPGSVDVLVNCAGIPNGGRFSGRQVMEVNWLGLRHLTETLLNRMQHGSAVVHVASTAGRAWPSRIDLHRQLMEASTFEEGQAWVAQNPDVVGDGYVLSKEAVQYYTAWRSVQILSRGIRMNSVCPGITDTGIIGDFRKGMGEDIIDHAAAVAGRFAEPAEMAPAMMFLADSASSSYITGVNLNIDHGMNAARLTDQSDPALIWG